MFTVGDFKTYESAAYNWPHRLYESHTSLTNESEGKPTGSSQGRWWQTSWSVVEKALWTPFYLPLSPLPRYPRSSLFFQRSVYFPFPLSEASLNTRQPFANSEAFFDQLCQFLSTRFLWCLWNSIVVKCEL